MKNKNSWKENIYRPYLISLAIFVLILVMCVFYYKAIGVDSSRYSSIPLEGKGQIGDSWGMFTSIFSALAFGGLISTLIFQSASIAQAKKESDEQDNRYKKQQIENTFFRMLSIHSDLVKEIDLRKKDTLVVIASGRDAFTMFHEKLNEYYRASAVMGKYCDKYPEDNIYQLYREFADKNKKLVPASESDSELDVIGFSYTGFWREHRADLGHYFRFLFNLIKYVDMADLDGDEKLRYIKIVRAQLSDYEIVIIFYNSLSWMSVNKFKPLIEKYNILDNLPVDLIFDLDHKKFYAESAFKGGE
ncbi:Uncharacterised protein [Serratia fonticola]|uniref:putative phage abortive infection protein n=1 Tax=Serratia fonticola TaxID=47917 RepID=UPI00217890E5|nr:putative phage abortive infection protein [Serratia fonticola]CAI0890836.1 Uncharacterised protein [Serratia fonticola]